MWKLLPEGVAWKSPPLFNFQQTRDELVSALGAPPGVDCDCNGGGPYDAWALGFPCGLEMTVWIFHCRGPDLRVVAPNELACIEVYANDRDFDHIRFHMSVPMLNISRWTPDALVEPPKAWTLVRQDDNGHRCEIERFTSSCEADAAAMAFEARGHKQMYWVEGPGRLS